MELVESFTSLDIILGCMFSNKTTELLRRLTIYKEMKLEVILVNSCTDTRTDMNFSTHNPIIGSSGKIETVKTNALEHIMQQLERYDVIGIDESSFFPDLKICVLNLVEKYKKKVIVAGLNGNYNRKNFGQINDLIPYCDSIIKLSAFCQLCCDKKCIIRSAHFTKRIVSNDTEILVGGNEFYVPVCRECFLK
jgi:thymidine kinase